MCAIGGMEGESSKISTGAYRGRGAEKLVIRYVRTKWIAPIKFCGIFFVHWFGQVFRASSLARKMSLLFPS